MSVGNNNVGDASVIWSWSSKKSRQGTTKSKTSILVDIFKWQTIPGNFAPTFVLLLQLSNLGYDQKSNLWVTNNNSFRSISLKLVVAYLHKIILSFGKLDKIDHISQKLFINSFKVWEWISFVRYQTESRGFHCVLIRN